MNNVQKLRTIGKLDATFLGLQATFNTESASIRQRKLKIVKSVIVACTECGSKHALGNFGFVQDHWYTSPHGCTEGDYWNMSKTEVCHLVCPQCSTMVYIYRHPMRDQIVSLVDSHRFGKEELFSAVWDKHGDREPKLRSPEP